MTYRQFFSFLLLLFAMFHIGRTAEKRVYTAKLWNLPAHNVLLAKFTYCFNL